MASVAYFFLLPKTRATGIIEKKNRYGVCDSGNWPYKEMKWIELYSFSELHVGRMEAKGL